MPATVVIPAHGEADRVGDTVRAAGQLPGVAEVVVVDDGSEDGTAEAARTAGADCVVVLDRNRGKGAALRAGVHASHHETLLFLDADLGASAAHAGRLLDAVQRNGGMSVAVLPATAGTAKAGFGLARGLAWAAIGLLAGFRSAAPLSGQRALSKALVEHIGLAPRFGVEVGLTLEAAHLGVPVREVPIPLEHRRTGRTLSGFVHRARQFWAVLSVLVLTGYGVGWPALGASATASRAAAWLSAAALLLALTLALHPSAFPSVSTAAAAGLLLWLPALWVSTVWLGIRKPNYLGRSLPAAAGLLFPLAAAPAFWLSGMGDSRRTAALIVALVLGAVGLLDDRFGRADRARGLGGHCRALLRGRLTTGAVKAIGGLAAGAGAGFFIHPGRPGLIVLDALLIALCANTVNLLDLRPGRALKGFALLSALAVAHAPVSLELLGPVLAAVWVAAPADLSGRAMMGDIGANVLGGAVGLAAAMHFGAAGLLVSVLLLGAVHVALERVSLTALIQRSPVLRRLDRLGARHLAPLPHAREASHVAQ